MSDNYATTWRELWANIRRSPAKMRNAALLLVAAVTPVAATVALVVVLVRHG